MIRFPQKRYALLVAILIVAGCHQPYEGMDEEYDRGEVVGCYKAQTLPNVEMKIGLSNIDFNGSTIYDKYQYGVDGKAISPLFYVWPRKVAILENGELKFVQYRDGKGSLTMRTEKRKGRRAVHYTTFNDEGLRKGSSHWFVKASCQGNQYSPQENQTS